MVTLAVAMWPPWQVPSGGRRSGDSLCGPRGRETEGRFRRGISPRNGRAVLFASLLEGASLNAALVIVPGHALVSWETWHGNNEWRCLETTLIGSADFDAACRSGQQIYDAYKDRSPSPLLMHPLADLRARGIWPME